MACFEWIATITYRDLRKRFKSTDRSPFVSISPDIDRRALEEERRRLNQRLEEVSRLCEGEQPPGVFMGKC